MNCGHYSPLLLHADNTLEQLTSTSTVLGLFPDWSCDLEQRQLRPGDILALYTDGIIEAFNDAGHEFGEQRLAEGLRQNGERSAEAIIGAIIDEVRRFSPREQHDDITLIVAKCK